MLQAEILELSSAFDELVAHIHENVSSLGQRAHQAAQTDLESAQQGIIAKANSEIKELQEVLEKFNNLSSDIAMLEQLSLITSHLRTVVADLENTYL